MLKDIVLCKDCYWWVQQKGILPGFCHVFQIYRPGDWYCASAARCFRDENDRREFDMNHIRCCAHNTEINNWLSQTSQSL